MGVQIKTTNLLTKLATSSTMPSLVPILTDWSDERYPLYAYHPSRHLPPAKVRAFLDFAQEVAANG